MAEEKEENTDEGEAKPKSKKKLIIIVLVVVLLLGAGVPILFLGGSKKEAAEDGEEHEVEKHYATYEMNTFIVNLSENSSFLKVKMVLEYDPSLVHGAGGGEAHGGGGAGGGGESGPPGVIGEKFPQINDAIITVLSSKRAENVLTVDGKEELKEELIEAINEATGLDEGPIVNIYFKEFIIQ